MLRLVRRPLLASLAAGSTLFACQAHASAASSPAGGAAVVVGVSYRPGVGYAVAQRFAEGGMKVGIIGRQQAALDDCKNAILREVPGATVECAVADATKPEEVAAAFANLRKAHGAPEALVYNLSCRPFPLKTVAEITPERLEADWRTGPYAALLCVQQVLPAMRERGSGTIIFSGASASLRGSKTFGSFGVSKCGLRALAQSMAKEVGVEGVHVAHVIIDGMVDMPVIHKLAPNAPQGRMIDTAGIAETYWNLHMQEKRCYSFEVDLRPYEAQW